MRWAIKKRPNLYICEKVHKFKMNCSNNPMNLSRSLYYELIYGRSHDYKGELSRSPVELVAEPEAVIRKVYCLYFKNITVKFMDLLIVGKQGYLFTMEEKNESDFL